MALGVQTLPAISSPMQAMTQTMAPTGAGTAGRIVGPGKMMIDILLTIAQGINNLTALTLAILGIEQREEQRNLLRLRDQRIGAADVVPTPTGEAPPPAKKDDPLAGLKSAFSDIPGLLLTLAGIGAMIAAISLLNKYSDQIATLLAPILKFMSETLIPNLQEIHNIITDQPGGYFTAFGAVGLVTAIVEFFGVKGKLANLFSSAATTVRGIFDPKTLMLRENSKTWTYKLTQALVGKSKRGPGGGGLIPKISSFFTRLASTLRTSWTGKVIMGVFDSIKTTTTWFTGKLKNIFSVLDDSVKFLGKISGLTRFLKIGLSLTKAIPILGQIVMAITGIFGFITGAIEGWTEGPLGTSGFMGMLLGGLQGLWDGLFGEFMNLIADILGWIAKKFGMEGLGEFLSQLDFTGEAIWKFFTEWLPGIFFDIKNAAVTAFDNTIQAIKDFFTDFDLAGIIVGKIKSMMLTIVSLFNRIKNSFYSGMNTVIDGINKVKFWGEPIERFDVPAEVDIDTSMDETGIIDETPDTFEPAKYKNPRIDAPSGTALATGELLAAVTGQKGVLATEHMRQSTIIAPVSTTDSSTNVNNQIVYGKSVDPVDNTALQLAKKEYAHFWMSQ